jgi:hypothetical protein
VARARRPDDWDRDLAGAREVEQLVLRALRADRRLRDVEDHTSGFDHLDFGFQYCASSTNRGRGVTVSSPIQSMAPACEN